MVEELYPLYDQYDQSILVFNKLHPIEKKEINKILENFKNVYVVEDHFSSNGLYDSICNLIINSNINFNLISISPKDYDLEVGTNLKYFFKKHNLDIDSVKSKIK